MEGKGKAGGREKGREKDGGDQTHLNLSAPSFTPARYWFETDQQERGEERESDIEGKGERNGSSTTSL